MTTTTFINRSTNFATSLEEDTFDTYFTMMCTERIYDSNSATLYYEGDHEVPEWYDLLFNGVYEELAIIDDEREPVTQKIAAINEVISIANELLGFSRQLNELNDTELKVILSDDFWDRWRIAIKDVMEVI